MTLHFFDSESFCFLVISMKNHRSGGRPLAVVGGGRGATKLLAQLKK
jgi:hypothetical protein